MVDLAPKSAGIGSDLLDAGLEWPLGPNSSEFGWVRPCVGQNWASWTRFGHVSATIRQTCRSPPRSGALIEQHSVKQIHRCTPRRRYRMAKCSSRDAGRRCIWSDHSEPAGPRSTLPGRARPRRRKTSDVGPSTEALRTVLHTRKPDDQCWEGSSRTPRRVGAHRQGTHTHHHRIATLGSPAQLLCRGARATTTTWGPPQPPVDGVFRPATSSAHSGPIHSHKASPAGRTHTLCGLRRAQPQRRIPAFTPVRHRRRFHRPATRSEPLQSRPPPDAPSACRRRGSGTS